MKLRRIEAQLMFDTDLFGKELVSQLPGEKARFDKWIIQIDISTTGTDYAITDYRKQTTTFFLPYVNSDTMERMDTIAHEFRHLMPANNALSQGWRDLMVPGTAPSELDAKNWACAFWKSTCK